MNGDGDELIEDFSSFLDPRSHIVSSGIIFRDFIPNSDPIVLDNVTMLLTSTVRRLGQDLAVLLPCYDWRRALRA